MEGVALHAEGLGRASAGAHGAPDARGLVLQHDRADGVQLGRIEAGELLLSEPELALRQGHQAGVGSDLRETDEVEAIVGADVHAAVTGDALRPLEVGLHVAPEAALCLAADLVLREVLLHLPVAGGGELLGAGRVGGRKGRPVTSQSCAIW